MQQAVFVQPQQYSSSLYLRDRGVSYLSQNVKINSPDGELKSQNKYLKI